MAKIQKEYYGFTPSKRTPSKKPSKPSDKKNCRWVCEKKTVKQKMDERSTVKPTKTKHTKEPNTKEPAAVPSFRNKPL